MSEREVICGVCSRGDAQLVAIAADLARSAAARLVLLRCLPPLRLKLGDGERIQHARALSHAKRATETLARGIDTEQPVSTAVQIAKPKAGLRHAAARRGTTALVLGSGRGEALGDVAANVAASAAAPVVIVPEGSRRLPERQTVVAGYDGAPASRAALDAIARVLPQRARTVLGTALPHDRPTPTEPPLEHGVEMRWLEGHPGQALGELAESTNADLLAVGANSHAGPSEPLLGSTVRHLCRTARRPVFVTSPQVAPQCQSG